MHRSQNWAGKNLKREFLQKKAHLIRKYKSKSSLVLIVGDMNAIFVKKKKDDKKIVSERRAVER